MPCLPVAADAVGSWGGRRALMRPVSALSYRRPLGEQGEVCHGRAWTGPSLSHQEASRGGGTHGELDSVFLTAGAHIDGASPVAAGRALESPQQLPHLGAAAGRRPSSAAAHSLGHSFSDRSLRRGSPARPAGSAKARLTRTQVGALEGPRPAPVSVQLPSTAASIRSPPSRDHVRNISAAANRWLERKLATTGRGVDSSQLLDAGSRSPLAETVSEDVRPRTTSDAHQAAISRVLLQLEAASTSSRSAWLSLGSAPHPTGPPPDESDDGQSPRPGTSKFFDAREAVTKVDLSDVGLPAVRKERLETAKRLGAETGWSRPYLKVRPRKEHRGAGLPEAPQACEAPSGCRARRSDSDAASVVSSSSALQSAGNLAREAAMSIAAPYRVAARALEWDAQLRASSLPRQAILRAAENRLKGRHSLAHGMSQAEMASLASARAQPSAVQARRRGRHAIAEARRKAARARHRAIEEAIRQRAQYEAEAPERFAAQKLRRDRQQAWLLAIARARALSVPKHVVTAGRLAAAALAFQTTHAVRIQSWWRGNSARLFVKRYAVAHRELKRVLRAAILRRRFVRSIRAHKVVVHFLESMRLVSRQRYIMLRFKRYVSAARIISRRWNAILVRREARAGLVAHQLRQTEFRMLVAFAVHRAAAAFSFSQVRRKALEESISRPARLRQLRRVVAGRSRHQVRVKHARAASPTGLTPWKSGGTAEEGHGESGSSPSMAASTVPASPSAWATSATTPIVVSSVATPALRAPRSPSPASSASSGAEAAVGFAPTAMTTPARTAAVETLGAEPPSPVVSPGLRRAPSRFEAKRVAMSAGTRARREYAQARAFIEADIASLPQIPAEKLEDEAARLTEFIEHEHRDLLWQHARIMKAMQPFYSRMRREAELQQRMSYTGAMHNFAFKPERMDPSARPPPIPRISMALQEDVLQVSVVKLRRRMFTVTGDAAWLLETASVPVNPLKLIGNAGSDRSRSPIKRVRRGTTIAPTPKQAEST